MHGKVSRIRHDGRGCFNGVAQGFNSTRYHSLAATINTLPDDLAITAATAESGVVMGVRHRTYTVEAMQYHPESILSEAGDDVLKNFLSLKGGTWEENPASRVLDVSLPPFPIETSDGKPPKQANKLPTILERIYAQRLKDVELAKSTPGTTPVDLETLLSMNLSPPLIPLVARMRTTTRMMPALMAEIKRASPSKGAIAMSTNAAQQALTYALSGASVISVLTEPTWFKGSLLDMRLARQAVDALPNRPAILRKDFVLDEYQIAEARLHGADTVLLIVAMLPVHRLKALYTYSCSLGMEPLVEVNNAAEMEQALALGARVIGVNNRNLHDFQVDMDTTSRLADMVREKGVILCALSGITSNKDVRTYVEQGVGAVLIGEALMRAKDTGAFIQELLGWPAPDIKAESHTPLVKICGIRTVEEAEAVHHAGADMLGLMFVPTSKRHISLERACEISTAIRASRTPLVSPSPAFPAETDEEPIRNAPWFATHARRLSASPVRPLLVGVFQNQPLQCILDTVASAQLDLVQLHGTEPPQWAAHIPVPVIRVFHVSRDRGIEGIARPGLHAFVLLDSARAQDGLSGGSGQVVDWQTARAVVEAGELLPPQSESLPESVNGAAPSVLPMPIILAGGLTPDNVWEAVETVRPWAVDVSGGVETADGKGKDIEKVRLFINAAKGVQEEAAKQEPDADESVSVHSD